MNLPDSLQSRYPGIAAGLVKLALAELPTPVCAAPLDHGGESIDLWIKQDDRTGRPYGGNKVRKLEYLLRPAVAKGKRRIATFGAAGSHHALATALYARQIGLPCTAFLGHQHRAPSVGATLNMHIELGTEIVRYGGPRARRVAVLRRHLRDRDAWVVPTGGSSWLGSVGFVDAGLELAGQARAGLLPLPDRLYVATGTMGTAAGLALGLALAGAGTEIHAVRVSDRSYANPAVLARLQHKTAAMLHRLDAGFPADLGTRTRVVLRDGWFGDGYAHSNPATDAAVACARDRLGLRLETTYTGKALAALLGDVAGGRCRGQTILFWNTYHSKPLPARGDRPLDPDRLPESFLSYFD